MFPRPDTCRLSPAFGGFFLVVDFRLRRHQTDSRRRKCVATGFLPHPVMHCSQGANGQRAGAHDLFARISPLDC